jgi:hypothetical protein
MAIDFKGKRLADRKTVFPFSVRDAVLISHIGKQ